MPIHGGLTPGFERYGGRAPALKAIVDSLGSQRGTAYDTTQPSNVYIENMAIARAIAEAWSNNQRMANQWDSARMTEFIPRWEKILALAPLSTDTDTDRRTRIGLAFARTAQTNVYQTVFDQLSNLLGSVFVGAITHTSTDDAVIWTPAGQTALNSSNTDVSLHDSSGVTTFYSTVAHILIETQQPSTMNDSDFYATVAQMNPVLDNLLPAWVTWDWYRKPSGSPGFYLDSGWAGGAVPAGVTPVNLDNEVLTT